AGVWIGYLAHGNGETTHSTQHEEREEAGDDFGETGGHHGMSWFSTMPSASARSSAGGDCKARLLSKRQAVAAIAASEIAPGISRSHGDGTATPSARSWASVRVARADGNSSGETWLGARCASRTSRRN